MHPGNIGFVGGGRITRIVPALKRMVCAGARTLLESALTPAEVMDLIPVKPLAGMEPQVSEMHRARLPGTYRKIKPGMAIANPDPQPPSARQ